jgi:hypothetical protein
LRTESTFWCGLLRLAFRSSWVSHLDLSRLPRHRLPFDLIPTAKFDAHVLTVSATTWPFLTLSGF